MGADNDNGDTVTAPNLRQFMIDVLRNAYNGWVESVPEDVGFAVGAGAHQYELVRDQADALLADPTFATIIDLALVGMMDGLYADPPPEIRALLVDWLAPQ